MTFEWPLALLLTLTVPVVLGVYLVAMRRRRKQAVSYSSVALLRSVLPRRSGAVVITGCLRRRRCPATS